MASIERGMAPETVEHQEQTVSARVVGLGHIGVYVQDLELMAGFYRDFLGMTVTKTADNGVFLSSDPARSDHEIALLKGRPSLDDPHLIQQISLRVETLDDLRDFLRRIKAEGRLERVISHASAIGCYFRDPEGNTTEVFWRTGLPSWVMLSIPIDIERPNDEVMAYVRRGWELARHVDIGEKPDADTVAAIRSFVRDASQSGPVVAHD
jgi:catechol-2,3-dioxygenase